AAALSAMLASGLPEVLRRRATICVLIATLTVLTHAFPSLAEAAAGSTYRRVPLRQMRHDSKRVTSMRDLNGFMRHFRAGVVLARWKDSPEPEAFRVPAGEELQAARALAKQSDVVYAEPDFLLARQFTPADPGLADQWHHRT